MALTKDKDLIKSNKLVNYLSLFTSSGTIICCALPALLVSMGAGAVLSSFIAVFPQLVILSIYKIPIFIGAFIMLIIAGMLQYQTKGLPCPADKKQVYACMQTRKASIIIYFTSVGIFIIGLLFAFIIPLFI